MDIKLKSKLSKIKAMVFDIDGVFTDGTIAVSENDVIRSFSMRDGYAVQMAANQSYILGVVSGAKQESVKKRMQGLGVSDIHLAVATNAKKEYVLEFIKKHHLSQEEVLFMGDDIPDYLVMNNLKTLNCCPADAVSEVIDIADYICEKKGGDGAVREVIEMVMKFQKKWMVSF